MNDKNRNWNQYGCLDIEQDANDPNNYFWYVNEKNIYLETELKQNSKNEQTQRQLKNNLNCI